MSIVTLVSGGLDSTLMAVMIKEERLEQFPVFIDYGQLGVSRERAACRSLFRRHSLPKPLEVDVSDWGRRVSSGITNRSLRIFEDAFLPGRNLLFLLIASSIAYRRGATSIAIGLLADSTNIFPDQTRKFCDLAQILLNEALGTNMKVLTPLKGMSKREVVAAARTYGISGTYSCHSGRKSPCGVCVACREYIGIEV